MSSPRKSWAVVAFVAARTRARKSRLGPTGGNPRHGRDDCLHWEPSVPRLPACHRWPPHALPCSCPSSAAPGLPLPTPLALGCSCDSRLCCCTSPTDHSARLSLARSLAPTGTDGAPIAASLALDDRLARQLRRLVDVATNTGLAYTLKADWTPPNDRSSIATQTYSRVVGIRDLPR